jgi:hypothetical protein
MITLEHILFYEISGHETTPNSWPCLSVFLTGYLTGVVLLAAYSGAITSFLSVQTRGEPPFRGFQGLLNEGSYRLGVTPGSAVDMFRVRKLNALLLMHNLEEDKGNFISHIKNCYGSFGMILIFLL